MSNLYRAVAEGIPKPPRRGANENFVKVFQLSPKNWPNSLVFGVSRHYAMTLNLYV